MLLQFLVQRAALRPNLGMSRPRFGVLRQCMLQSMTEQQEPRRELAHDLVPGDYLVDYQATVVDSQTVIDNPVSQTASILLDDGRTVLVPGYEDLAVR